MDGVSPQAPESELPQLVSFEAKTRDIVIGSIKLTLRRLRKKGVLTCEGEYVDLLKDPAALAAFIQSFKENRDVAKDVAVDTTGKPVEDDGTTLVCGLTLGQVERLLVYTCAKKRLAAINAASEGGDAKAGSTDLPDAIKEVIGFGWQLPLLDIYLGVMKEGHFRALGRRILGLRKAEVLAQIAAMDAQDLRNAERIMGADFEEAFQQNPVAIRGVAACKPNTYKMLKKAAGRDFWSLLSGDPQVVLELSATAPDRVAALAPVAARLCPEVFNELESVPDTVLAPLVTSFCEVFGDAGGELLSEPEFAKKYLFGIVGSMRGMKAVNEAERTAATQAAKYKWDAVRDDVMAWWAARPN